MIIKKQENSIYFIGDIMNSTSFSFLLTILAGFSSMLGCLVIFIKKIDHNKIIACSLAFASGVMLTVSVTDLIPESLKLIDFKNYYLVLLISFISIFLGIFLSVFLNDITEKKTNNNILYKTGLLSMLAIIIHNIPEGIITFITANSNISLGISLAIAIALHNIPEGISISVPIYYSTNSKLKAILYTFISAISEPFGAVITYLFLINYINNTILGILFSIIAGIMLEISIFNLLPTSKKYHYDKARLIFFILGVFLMVLKFLI